MAAEQATYDLWKDGGAAKVALHAAVGASISGLTGGPVAGGALSAGASEAAAPLTAGQTKLVQELASTVIGAAGAAIGGGSATAGGATALAGQQYNRELHASELAALEKAKAGKTPEEQHALDMAACAMVECWTTGTADGDNPFVVQPGVNGSVMAEVQAWVAANPGAFATAKSTLQGQLGFGDAKPGQWDTNYYSELIAKKGGADAFAVAGQPSLNEQLNANPYGPRSAEEVLKAGLVKSDFGLAYEFSQNYAKDPLGTQAKIGAGATLLLIKQTVFPGEVQASIGQAGLADAVATYHGGVNFLQNKATDEDIGHLINLAPLMLTDGLGRAMSLTRISVGGTKAVGTLSLAGTASEVAETKAIIVTPKGVAVTPDVLGLQGTSELVGDFRGIQGSRVEDIISRVPSDWMMLPQKQGMGVRFVDGLGVERLRLHGPSNAAPAGSNSASGWTARVHAPNNEYYDNLGNLVGPKDNSGHIPISGNPNVGP